MTFDPRTVIRSHLIHLPPYIPIEPHEILSARFGFNPEKITKLDANENPYGPSRLVKEVLTNLAHTHIYPDPESRILRKSLGKFLGMDPNSIMPGSGADELIDLIIHVTLDPGDAVLICQPTFGMYEFDASTHLGRIINIPRNIDFSLDLDGIKDKVRKDQPKLIFLAHPNNPDGSLLSSSDLEILLDLPVLVVVDEAYIEFSGFGKLGAKVSYLSLLENHQNLVILRTFSKWAGLAGLRIGYGLFPFWLMEILWKAKQPYNVNVAASSAAIASLQDLLYLEENVNKIIAERARLANLLAEIKHFQVFPSFGNFLLCKVSGSDAGNLKARLAEEHGILIRHFEKQGLQNMVRITVGKPEQSDRLLHALHEILN